jgi:hypothetical protein
MSEIPETEGYEKLHFKPGGMLKGKFQKPWLEYFSSFAQSSGGTKKRPGRH